MNRAFSPENSLIRWLTAFGPMVTVVLISGSRRYLFGLGPAQVALDKLAL